MSDLDRRERPTEQTRQWILSAPVREVLPVNDQDLPRHNISFFEAAELTTSLFGWLGWELSHLVDISNPRFRFAHKVLQHHAQMIEGVAVIVRSWRRSRGILQEPSINRLDRIVELVLHVASGCKGGDSVGSDACPSDCGAETCVNWRVLTAGRAFMVQTRLTVENSQLVEIVSRPGFRDVRAPFAGEMQLLRRAMNVLSVWQRGRGKIGR